MKLTSLILLGAIAVVCGSALAESKWSEPIEWPSRPSDMRQLSFTRPGRIAGEVVAEGQSVKVGDVLIQQDDAIEQEDMKMRNLLAEDKTRVNYAQTALEKARVDLEQAEHAAESDGVTQWELREAKLEVQMQEASLEIAKLEKKQNIGDRDQMKIRLTQMKLASPIAGVVERVYLHEGESADALEKVLVVVQINPLWVDLPVPVAQARRLKVDQEARIQYVDEPIGSADGAASKPIVGKIVHKASVADAASKTLTIRVEYPNSELRPAGEHIRVSFDIGASSAPKE